MLNFRHRFQMLDEKSSAFQLLQAIGTLFNSQVIKPFGLNFAASATTGRTSTSGAGYAIINGSMVKVAASTALPALTGVNLTTGQAVGIVYLVDTAGTITALAGPVVTGISNVKFPQQNRTDQICIGYLIIEAGATFTGGTTALDAASITSTFADSYDGLPAVSAI